MLHHLERKRSVALRTGRRMSTSGAATAPLCLKRKARFVPSADSSAQMRPTPTASETLLTARPSSECASGAKALLRRDGFEASVLVDRRVLVVAARLALAGVRTREPHMNLRAARVADDPEGLHDARDDGEAGPQARAVAFVDESAAGIPDDDRELAVLDRRGDP